MLEALLLGVATALPLMLGAIVGVAWKVPKRVLAAVLAFGAGTLIASVSDGLFAPAFREIGGGPAAGALLLGTLTFVVASRWLDHRPGGSRSAVGWALLLGVLLDGIPENAALGVDGGVDVALLAAIAIGNAPEAIGGAATMHGDAHVPRGRVLLIWAGVSVVLTLVVPLARAGADTLGASGIAGVEAFAGGAVLAVLADSMIPEAYEGGGKLVALATACGFALAFALGG